MRSRTARAPRDELLSFLEWDAARAHIQARTGKPVTLSTELSTDLDAPRRALTAALNARLIARVSTLIDAVHRAMAQLQIACPLMIVKGDGTLALAETVALRPIETVLSGPAGTRRCVGEQQRRDGNRGRGVQAMLWHCIGPLVVGNSLISMETR